jgi:predicted TIM-barrel fold metal-dependent hydrolase
MGIEKVLIAMGRTPHLADPTPAQLVEKNNDMMAALDAFPNETLGLVYVSPKHPAASVAEIDRCLKHPRVVGLLFLARPPQRLKVRVIQGARLDSVTT